MLDRRLLAVIIGATIIPVPWVIWIIIRRVISVKFRFGRVIKVIGVPNIGAAAKQQRESRGGDQ